MTKTYLVNASVAALVSAFVFTANITPAAACWGPNKEFGGLECGKGGGTDGASQSSQTQPSPSSGSQSSGSQSSGLQTSQGPNTRPLPRPDRPQQSGGNDGDWNKGDRPSRQSDNGDWGGYGGGADKRKDGDWGNRPKRTSDCRYGCGDDRPSRRPRDDDYGSYSGKVYHPNRGPYASDGYGYPSRHRDDDYGGYRRSGDVVVIRPPRIGVILGSGYGGYGRGGY